MASLKLYPLSDSFATVWPGLASECGLELAVVNDSEPAGDPLNSVCLVVGAGVEHEIEGLLRKITGADTTVAAIGALPDHRLAVGLIKAGATEYFALPQDYEPLRSWLRERAARLESRVQRTAFAAGESDKYRFDGILGESPVLRRALDRAARVIPHPNVTVLITGETGTGKELLARAIHYNGPRRESPFVDINCAAIPDNLLETELFGHEKGAFTGATSAKPGLFEVADGGTLFLDEIGHLSLVLQGKILRALEERAVRRVGGSRSKSLDVRVLAATHVDLAAAVRRGDFREDLYHRLNVLPIELPPLRARPEDIVPLSRHFLTRFAAEYGVDEPAITPAAEQALRRHPWPGNVRELRNLLERAVLLCAGGALDPSALDLEAAPEPASEVNPTAAPLRRVVRAVVTEALERCGGNKSEAARQLRISRTRLQRLLETASDHLNTSDEDL